MDKESLETYQVQLSQVEIALAADPENAELASLRSELKELINLTTSLISQSESTASSSKPTESSRKTTTAQQSITFSAGDECLAKYSGDGGWYPARINSVAGSAENRVYSIVFKSYNTTEQLEASSLKPLPHNHNLQPSAKRKAKEEEEEEKERKRKKNEKKLETRAAKAKEQVQKQASWQKFAKKSEKKGVHIAGMAGTSIFKTPDNPLGRVGVTGSGKGMTDYQAKRKTQVRSSPRAGVISPLARSHQPRPVVVGHREHVDGRSGGHGFTAHIRDVYFSCYL